MGRLLAAGAKRIAPSFLARRESVHCAVVDLDPQAAQVARALVGHERRDRRRAAPVRSPDNDTVDELHLDLIGDRRVGGKCQQHACRQED